MGQNRLRYAPDPVAVGRDSDGLMIARADRSTMVDDVAVRGIDLDSETRCAHYDSPQDVIAIRFFCCGEYYTCYECHAVRADHDAERWPADARSSRAVLCGVCRAELTILEYLSCDDACPACGAAFNPACAGHHHHYFAGVSEASGPDRP